MGVFWMRETTEGFCFVLRAANGAVVASGREYGSSAECSRVILRIRKCASVPVEDQTVKRWRAVRSPKFRLWRDERGLFRFCLLDRDEQSILSSKPYRSKAACLKGLDSVRRNAEDAPVWEE